MRFEMKDCGGCRTCELACGFHHTGVFNPNKSSLKVIDRNDGKPGFYIDFQLFDDENAFGCDGCPELDQPLCVQYCHEATELLEMIEVIQAEKKKQ